jgi:hypothetical protein
MSILKVYQTTAYEVDWKKLADEVEKLVMAKLDEDLKHWKDDRSMRAMFLCDAGDSLEVCQELAEGSWHKAEKRLWDMDTAARDYVYDFIEQVAGSEFFDAVRV